jgi:hypothetical protein
MAIKHCLEDDEIEGQLKYNICDVRLCFLGCKGKIQLHDAGVEACTYVEQLTKMYLCILNFIIFKNKYLGLCMLVAHACATVTNI